MSKRQITTQIGCLPHDDVDEAVAYSLRHDIPFLPELPKLGDAMMDYIKNPGNMSCLETFKKKVSGRKTIKIQCVGPATLMLGGYGQDDAFARSYQHIDALINGLDVENIILFLDEPALGQAGFDYRQLWSPLFESFDVTSGVHVCGNMNWDEMFASEIDIISFDASKFDITKYPGYRSGKRIAWGVEAAEDVRDFQDGDLLTPPCGMGPKFFNTDDCETVFGKLSEISKGYIS
ncbi:MAG: uroporphyrinogen decarboxylase/cobalamine-independent methonine synthase family protein [Planctomycetota bacterium]